MSTTVTRARLLTTGGALLSAAALAAATLFGPAAFADTHTGDVTVEATVDDTIELTANEATVALNEAPGETATVDSSLTVESNNFSGYNVTATPGAATLDGATEGNDDTIDIGALSLNGEVLAHDGTTATDTEIHTQPEQSVDGGDNVAVNYSLAVPFVAADQYDVGVTFTATAND